jgi:exonuclease VII large subunit
VKKEKTLIGGLTVLGLALMYQTAGIQPDTTEIEDIGREKVGDKVSVSGEIENLTAVRDTVFFTLKDENKEISAVTFRENLLLHEGLQIKASGKITLHRGETEFVLNRIIRKK